VSPTASDRPARRGRYHHGDLKAALVDAAIELIAERGVRDFSLAEASRRLGVTVAAPYRHFADRDELLAAVAVRAFEVFSGTMASAYVRFAADHRPLFDAAFGSGIDKSRYPEVERAARPVTEAFLAAVRDLCDGDEDAAQALVTAVGAAAHGHAALLIDGAFGQGGEAAEAAAGLAALGTLALVRGREALRGPVSP
jgi:AcrR family transcriptional regulator